MEKIRSSKFEDHYQVNDSLLVKHYKPTKEIALVNCDTGEEFLMAEDYEEAVKVCEFILSLVKGNGS